MVEEENSIIRTTKTGSMKERDLVFVDIETTGLLPVEHEIIDIAVIRVEQSWPTEGAPQFMIKDEWTTKVHPEHLISADPASLKISGYIASEWTGAVSLQEALATFVQKTEGAIMVAHNIAFDSEFLNFHLAQNKLVNTMHYHRLDTVSMAFAVLQNAPGINRYSLGELCKYFGIENQNAHTALSDARADFELFKKLILRMYA